MPARNYKGEYRNYHSSTEQKKRRASRNTARRRLTAAGKVKKGDKKDVAHKNGNPKDNRKSNLRLLLEILTGLFQGPERQKR